MNPLNRNLRSVAALTAAASLALCLLSAQTASAATTIYVGTNGVSVTTNWSDTANFIDATSHNPESPANNAANFNFNTAVGSPGIVTVNADGNYGSPGSGSPQAWGLIFGHTNGYHTVLIQPGLTFEMIAANGTAGGGGMIVTPANQNSGGNTGGNTVSTGPYTNHTTIWGTNASFLVNGQFRVEGPASADENHYTILDMSGLDTFTATNTSAGSSRFQVVNGSQRSQALVYLAKTNFINIYSDITIGWMGGVYSNSLPIGLYLGQSNSITTGPNDNGNQLALGIQGVTNAFIKFNPAVLGGASKPVAYISGNGASTGNGGFPTVSGMMAGALIGRADGAKVPSYGIADFTGGVVIWNVGQLHLGRAGAANGTNTTATGVLSFDSGTITANDVWCGWQQFDASGAQGANPGIGIINVGANATLQVNNTLRLGLVTGTQAAGTTGALNINGGTAILNLVTNSATATGDLITMTNGTLGVTLNQVGITNIPVSTLNLGGTTNLINIVAITPELGSGFPVRFHLLSYKTLNGALNLGLGTLPTSYNPSYTYGGYLDTTSVVGLVDFVLTQGPPAARILNWSGLNGGIADGNWDVGSTLNWLTNGIPTTYNQFDLVNFTDSATGTTNVVLTTTLTPFGVVVSNTALTYTLGGAGQISGTAGLTKLGANALILDDSGGNNFSGGIAISNGTVQVGNADGNGNLGSGPIVDKGNLLFDHGAQSTIANTISGSGTVVQGGADSLTLSGTSTYTGATLVTNNSTLQVGSTTALGATNGAVIIASGSTLDANGFSLGGKPILVSGTGVGGNGAITDSGGPIYDSPGGLTSSLTLTGDATFNFPTRWDLGSSSGAVLSTGGKPYNLTLVGGTGVYHEWLNVHLDTNLANINVLSANLGAVGSTTFGNPTNSLNLLSGAQLTFYNSGAVNVLVNKQVVFNDGATIQNGGGASTMMGNMVLTNSGGSALCEFEVGGTSLTLSNIISGDGILYKQNGGSPLILSGNSPAFTGGVALWAGSLILNGTVGCGITNQLGTSIYGTGTASGSLDVAGGLTPGGAAVAGTMTAGGLVLEMNANVTNNLTTATTVGGGVNSLIQVNGDLTANGNTLVINPLAALANGATYTVITYTGNLNGSGFAGAVTVPPYTLTLNNVTTSSPKKITVTVSGGSASTLAWNNASGNGEWDVNVSQNWSNLTTHVAPDYFVSFDPVLFLDTITNSATPTTSIDIAAGQVVIPSVMTNNSTTNYTISGAGKISSSAAIVKQGSSTLTILTTDDFTGPTTIQGGTLKAGATAALGATNGTIYVTNGATLDLIYSLGNKPLVISGAGVGGLGALVNNDSSGTPIYDNPGGLLNVTLAGNATIGGTNRMDFGQISPASGVVNSGGSNYSLTVVGTTYREWDNVVFDTNFGNINVMTTGGGTVGIKGASALGNPTNTLAVFSNATVVLYEDSGSLSNVTVNKKIQLYGGSTFQNGGGTNVILGPMVLGVANGDACTNNIGGTSLAVSNVISGPGSLVKTGGSPLYLAAINTYTGNTVLASGPLNLIGNGSISASTDILLASGTTLDVSGRTDGTLTLAGTQTLAGSGSVNGNLTVSSGATVAPGTTLTTVGTLAVTTNASLQGTTVMLITAPTSSSQLQAASVNYGGTLSLVFTPGTLAAGNSFKLFNASSYNLSFASVTPATPGAGLAWNISGLSTGVVSVVAATVSRPDITSITVGSGNVILKGTNGSAGGNYYILTSTNVLTPLTNWTVLTTNNYFDGLGNFNVTNAISPGPQRFYMIAVP